MKRIPIIVSIALAFGLAACSDQGGGGTKTQEPAAESKAPEAKPVAESKAPEAKPAAPACFSTLRRVVTVVSSVVMTE